MASPCNGGPRPIVLEFGSRNSCGKGPLKTEESKGSQKPEKEKSVWAMKHLRTLHMMVCVLASNTKPGAHCSFGDVGGSDSLPGSSQHGALPLPLKMGRGHSRSLSDSSGAAEGKGLQTLPREGLQQEAARPPRCAHSVRLCEGVSSLSPVSDCPPPPRALPMGVTASIWERGGNSPWTHRPECNERSSQSRPIVNVQLRWHKLETGKW